MKIQRPLPNGVIQSREQCLPLHIGLIPIREGHRSLLVLRSSAQRHRPASGGLADDIANHRTRSQFRSRTVYMRRHRPTRRRHPPTSAPETELTTRVGVRRAWPLPLRRQQASPFCARLQLPQGLWRAVASTACHPALPLAGPARPPAGGLLALLPGLLSCQGRSIACQQDADSSDQQAIRDRWHRPSHDYPGRRPAPTPTALALKDFAAHSGHAVSRSQGP